MTTSQLPQLPRELWIIILEMKSKQLWNARKKVIHRTLHKALLPKTEHVTIFSYSNYRVYYHRTEHVEVMLTDRRGRLTESRTLQVFFPFKDRLSLKFVYCPAMDFEDYE